MRLILFISLVYILLVLSGILSNPLKSDFSYEEYEAFEYAYFKGQQDCINGHIKIEKSSDSCWKWIESPWKDGSHPIFKPCKKIN